MKVIIAGSRYLNLHPARMDEIMTTALRVQRILPTHIISGAHWEGVDVCGEDWAKRHRKPCTRFPADWAGQGNSAGPQRNRKMAEVADALVAVPIKGSKGTRNMVEEAEARGLRVHMDGPHPPAKDPILIRGDLVDRLNALPPQNVSLIYMDLPYGTTRCSWDVVIPWEDLWPALYRHLAEKGAIVLHAADPFASALIASNKERYAYPWYWDKGFSGSYVQAKRMPMRCVEEILVFSHDGKMPAYYPQVTPRDKPIYAGGNKQSAAIPVGRGEAQERFSSTRKEYVDKQPTNFLSFPGREDRAEMKKLGLPFHPTQKSVALARYMIATYTRPGDLVIDACMGSGTVGVACLHMDRSFLGIERDRGWFRIACKRTGFY